MAATECAKECNYGLDPILYALKFCAPYEIIWKIEKTETPQPEKIHNLQCVKPRINKTQRHEDSQINGYLSSICQPVVKIWQSVKQQISNSSH